MVARWTHTPAPGFASRGHLASFVGGAAAGRPHKGQGRVLGALPLCGRVSVCGWGSGATPSPRIRYRVQTGKHSSPPPIGRHRHSWSACRPVLVPTVGRHASVGRQRWESLCWAQWWFRHGGRHRSLPFPVAGLTVSNGGCGTVAGALHSQSLSLGASPPIAAAAQLPVGSCTILAFWTPRHDRRVLQSSRRRPLPGSVIGRHQFRLQHGGRDDFVPVPVLGRSAKSGDSVTAAGALHCQPLAPASPPPCLPPPPLIEVAVQTNSADLQDL